MSQNEELMLQHLFDGGEWNVYDKNILNLGVGAPGPDLLEPCCDIFQKATDHRLKHEKDVNNSFLFQYGPASGCYHIRNEIAKYFSSHYDSEMLAEDLIITTGASQGLHFLLSTLVDQCGYIFVDEFTYMIALDSIKEFTNFKILSVQLNDDGVNLKDLEEKITQNRFISQTKEFWGLYYTIPTYHNPTGILFSEDVCRGIVKLARKYDILVVCDDVYNILNYGNPPLHSRLITYDARTDEDFKGNVISNGSLSKLIGPGVRLGWLEVPPRLKPLLMKSGILLSGGCFNNYTSGIVASLFQLNLAQDHISKFYDAYKERMIATTAMLKKELPDGCRINAPTGGYFIWVQLPQQIDASAFLLYCLEREKISFIPGCRFSLNADKGKNCFRISIAFHKKEALVDGAFRLCQALATFMSKNNTADH